jgi:Arc/MetJ-type ribon-helix-helix transcriptional regulator
MTIHLPKELETSLQAAVHGGHFASLDDAMAEAARLLLRDLKHRPQPPAADDDPILGMWRDDAELIDQIVDDAMRNRREQPWRLTPSE